MLYDLTALQRAANAQYAFPAARTLELAQALYDKKAIRYRAPRLFSTSINRELRRHRGHRVRPVHSPLSHDPRARDRDPHGLPRRRHEVTDHHAIIPTEQRVDPVALSPDEKRLYDLIARRFLAALYPTP